MARIVLNTFGSRGDLNPFLALAFGLLMRGHEVLFAVEDHFRPAVTAAGFPVHPLTGNFDAVLAAYPRQLFGGALPIFTARLLMKEYVLPKAHITIEELRTACTRADLFVSTSIQVLASIVADLITAPWVSIAGTPAFIPSAHIAPLPPPVALPGPIQILANRSSWAIGAAFLHPVLQTPINRLRAQYGLPSHRDLFYGNLSHVLTALMISPAFVSFPADWPPYIRQTGFCFWDTPSSWRESSELRAFLQGPKPVVAVSSGSMSPMLTDTFATFYQTSIAAIKRIGARALVIGAPPDLLPVPLPEDVYALPFAPFSHVYPRCAAVIHHGGMGTAAQALRAGVPALVTPWGGDQFFIAAQLEYIGAGRRISRRTYTLEGVVTALDELVHNQQYQERCKAIAAQIAQEDGVAALCDALEAVLGKSDLFSKNTP